MVTQGQTSSQLLPPRRLQPRRNMRRLECQSTTPLNEIYPTPDSQCVPVVQISAGAYARWVGMSRNDIMNPSKYCSVYCPVVGMCPLTKVICPCVQFLHIRRYTGPPPQCPYIVPPCPAVGRNTWAEQPRLYSLTRCASLIPDLVPECENEPKRVLVSIKRHTDTSL
jgi:hypothetical protein